MAVIDPKQTNYRQKMAGINKLAVIVGRPTKQTNRRKGIANNLKNPTLTI